MSRERLIAVARGDAEPDLVIEDAHVYSAFTREWIEGDVAVADGRIAGVGAYAGGRRIDAHRRYLVPGFIDAHVHLESAKLVPAEFARAVVPRGTTAVVCDPHELANVAGVDGVRWLLEATEGLPLDVFVMAPSCVPASGFESPRGPLGPDAMREILRHPRALGVAEMMNFPGVIAGDPEVLARMVAPHVDGHAPGVLGLSLNAYAAAGIASDHEAVSAAEALEKRRRGMWVLIREASNARNLRALLGMVSRYGPEWCAFCTDDREPDWLLREGHIDQMCRVAVGEGVAPEDVLAMATLHGARAHGLRERGAIAPGYVADLVLLDDLVGFRASLVLKDGAEPSFPAAPVSGALRDTMRMAPVDASSFAIAGSAAAGADHRAAARPADHRRAQRASVRGGRPRRRRPGPRPGEDRRRRAPPRDGARRARAGARVRIAGGRVRLDRGARRAQPRGRGRGRRRHGAVRRPRGRARRRPGRRARRRGPRRARAPGRRTALGPARRAGGRPARGAAAAPARAGRAHRRAVHDAVVPRAVGDPRH